MLVLSRFPGQEILIGDDITITLVEVRRYGKARIGISAPKDIRVDRKEVRERINGGTPGIVSTPLPVPLTSKPAE